MGQGMGSPQALDGEGLQERPWAELEPPPTQLEALPHAGGVPGGLAPAGSLQQLLRNVVNGRK